MHHILGNKVLEYDVDDRGVIVDEREYDRTVNPKPNIADWVKEHMVFWYDMSKPVDTYIPGVTYANPFVNSGGKITYDNAINKCIITHTPTNNNNIAFWQIIVKPLQYVESYKIRVTGLPTGFTIKGRLGYDDIQITSDGEYDIPEYRNSSTTNTSYPGFYLAGDNVNDVDCNIVVEEIPTKQSVPTNEILKANPYLQDHSGNNRLLKLNNFLFAAMSGVGGYSLNAKSYHNRWSTLEGTFNDYSVVITAKVKDMLGLVWTENGTGEYTSVAVGKSFTRPAFTVTVEGMPDDLKWGLYEDNTPANKGNGTFEIPAYTYTNTTETVQNRFIGFRFNKHKFDNVNIKFTFQPLYPNALVTDGVDDYGIVENFKSLQNYMMFFQCAITRPNTVNGMFSTTSIKGNIAGWMLLQGNDAYYVRFGNNGYKNFKFTSSMKDKISYVLSANNGLMTCYVGEEKATIAGTYKQTGANMSLFLSDNNNKTRFGSMAFYKSILFDSVPTKETDGFTEQDLINYVLENLITQ